MYSLLLNKLVGLNVVDIKYNHHLLILDAQILTISTENVTVSYNTTAYLECSVFVNTTTLDTNDQVNLTITIQRSPPLDIDTLNYSL